MVKTINLFNTDFFVFILVVIIFIAFFIAYNLIKPEQTIPYNFQPYPNFSPKDIPDINVGSDSCFNKLTKCDVNGDCSSCGDSFDCVDSSTDGQYFMNGISVPQGKYCLPKNNNQNACNIHTGRWTWSDDPEYCNIVAGSNQCWKCLCLYPGIYSEEKGGCNTLIACKNTNTVLDQSSSKLVSTPEAVTDLGIPLNTPWDPLSKDDNVLKALQYSPYSSNAQGKPYFKCSCGLLANYPNDPYKCHLDGCNSANDYGTNDKIGVLVKVNDNGTMTCDCVDSGLELVKNENSPFFNTCASPQNPCGSGINQVECGSDYANPLDNKKPTQCFNPKNPFGLECEDKCPGCNKQNTNIPDNPCVQVYPGNDNIRKCDCKDGWRGATCNEKCATTNTVIDQGIWSIHYDGECIDNVCPHHYGWTHKESEISPTVCCSNNSTLNTTDGNVRCS